ncbi:hypothetical protein OHA84_27750 [Streptomyces sp. NBC_00513]|uniref:hypothetical protein n=1 Tax=unclassified Streptomyces TaxID=2593676 RepID=UPI00225ABC8D|nr:hypothetical protein [Streptomyces sp. NBC_00424]WUD43607.1 hypothetical protein OHA84_25600 [Streptomyces sp. NBC_00513]WUD43993.1 hypothetical protein OHA84_27750 [Streptomyces sp. NBC_00513]
MSSDSNSPAAAVGLVNRFKRWSLSSIVVATEAIQHFAEAGTGWGSDTERVQAWAIWALGIQLVVTGAIAVKRKLQALDFIELRLGRKAHDDEDTHNVTRRRPASGQDRQPPVRDNRPPTRSPGEGRPAAGPGERGARRNHRDPGQGRQRRREAEEQDARQPERDTHEGA